MSERGPRFPLASRFTVVFGLLLLVVFLLAAGLVQEHLKRVRKAEANLRVASLTRALTMITRPHLMTYDSITLQRIADSAMREPGLVRMIILDKEGVVLAYSGQRDRVGERASDPISLRGHFANEGFEVERVESGVGLVLERIRPVFDERGETRWGTIRLVVSLETLQNEVRAAGFLILQVALGGVLLIVAVSHLLARRITRPLRLLVEHSASLARGTWDHSFRLRTGDEIETLGERIRLTAESLEIQRRGLIDAHDELERLNTTLEEKVRERTAELYESRERYKLLLDASPDPLCLIQEGRFRFANRAFLETFGFTSEQVLSDWFSLDSVVHPDFARVAKEILAEAERSGGTIDTEWVGIGRGGRSLDLSVRGRRVEYLGAPAVELLWLDLTDRKRLLRQVFQNERLRAIGEMTTMVAHNFNNLLAVILGRSQLLLGRTSDPAVRKGLDIIRTTALQGGDIVRRIQDYSMETSKMQFQEVNVGSVMREVVAYLENYWRVVRGAQFGPIRIELHADPTPPVLGSEALLTDAFKHILDNSAEAMPSGGVITVTLRQAGETVQILIEDTGIGVSPEVRKRAFDPFFTTKGDRNRGLGLAASFGIVQRHRGRIDLRERVGGGALVEIFLPLHRSTSLDHAETDASLFVFSEQQESALRLRRSLRKRRAERPSGSDAAGRAGTDGRAA